VVGNQLRILPPDIGRLTKLRVLAADSNQLTILPGVLLRVQPGPPCNCSA
jgi:Leucine-rich repeat (LRR) protein